MLSCAQDATLDVQSNTRYVHGNKADLRFAFLRFSAKAIPVGLVHGHDLAGATENNRTAHEFWTCEGAVLVGNVGGGYAIRAARNESIFVNSATLNAGVV